MKNRYYSCKSYLQQNSFCFWYHLLFSLYPRFWFNLIGLGKLYKIRRSFIHVGLPSQISISDRSSLILRVLGCSLVSGVFSFSNMTAAAVLENEKTLRKSSARIPPSNKQQPLKKTQIGSTNHHIVKVNKQYNSRVLFFFLPSCVGADVFNLAKKPFKKVSQHNKILSAAANVLSFNEFKSTWGHA